MVYEVLTKFSNIFLAWPRLGMITCTILTLITTGSYPHIAHIYMMVLTLRHAARLCLAGVYKGWPTSSPRSSCRTSLHLLWGMSDVCLFLAKIPIISPKSSYLRCDAFELECSLPGSVWHITWAHDFSFLTWLWTVSVAMHAAHFDGLRPTGSASGGG